MHTPNMRRASRGRQCALAFVVGSALVCLYAMRQADPDLWGYLTYGRLFVETRGLTSHDPFAYTSAGFQWTTFEYGAQVLLWLAYHLAGPLGLIALKCAVGGATLCCLLIAVRATSSEPFVWGPIFLLCTSAICRFFLFRPQLFTFAFFALFVAVLFKYLLRRRAPLWALPVVMLAWANLHGGFVAGLGAIALAIVLRASENVTAFGWDSGRLAEGTRRLWVTLATCTVATFINPLGPRLWVYRTRRTVPQHKPSIHRRVGTGQPQSRRVVDDRADPDCRHAGGGQLGRQSAPPGQHRAIANLFDSQLSTVDRDVLPVGPTCAARGHLDRARDYVARFASP